MSSNNDLLDDKIDFASPHVGRPADPELIRKAFFWAAVGGIGGIILGHKLRYSSVFKDGKVQYIYDEESRLQGKSAQLRGLIVWIPIYLLLIGGYYWWVFSALL